MIRSTLSAAPALLLALLLGGCGGGENAPAANDIGANEAPYDNMTVDVSPDSLAAPSDVPLESESNAVGSASGGNAM